MASSEHSTRRKTPEEVEWLEAHVPTMTAPECIEAFEKTFGWAPKLHALQVWASKRHLRFGRTPSMSMDRATHIVRWSKEPEMEAWMLEHDKGQSTFEISTAFEERFGFPLARTQIVLFRSSHGTQTRRSHGGGKPRKPVGSERVGKGGYVMVKVREQATVPQSKDNWRFKHWIAWEEANGQEVPCGHTVLFVNGNIHDYRPENLVCIDRRYMAQLNGIKPENGWASREALMVALATVDLKFAIVDAKNRPRECETCGKTFTPDNRQVKQRTCRACLDAGFSARAPKAQLAICEECGTEYEKTGYNQKYCPDCSRSRYRRKKVVV